jgi:anhydro-N-acetylmuramic acid kinase
MLADGYFAQRPPKSTDGPAMIAAFERALGGVPLRSFAPDDLLATAAAITARAIGDAIRRFLPRLPDELFVSGGGIHNAAMMSLLRDELRGIVVHSTDEVGLESQAKEALAFALLGLATLDGIAANVPSATGASRAVVLGCITPRP